MARRNPYAAIGGRQLGRLNDQQLAEYAQRYAQEHQFGPIQAVGKAAFTPGGGVLDAGAGGAGQDVRLSLQRRRILAQSLANRTTESSRRRAAQRLMAGWGYGLGEPTV